MQDSFIELIRCPWTASIDPKHSLHFMCWTGTLTERFLFIFADMICKQSHESYRLPVGTYSCARFKNCLSETEGDAQSDERNPASYPSREAYEGSWECCTKLEDMTISRRFQSSRGTANKTKRKLSEADMSWRGGSFCTKNEFCHALDIPVVVLLP